MPFSRIIPLIGMLASAPALAQQSPTLLDRANAATSVGPVVLQLDPDRTRLGRPRVARNGDPAIADALPVPHVMNGSGFGYSGFDYYSDARTPARLGAPRQPSEIILMPARRAPLP